ncbi:MAG: nuclease-related domain-containing protein [Planctomycetota bacterium]
MSRKQTRPAIDHKAKRRAGQGLREALTDEFYFAFYTIGGGVGFVLAGTIAFIATVGFGDRPTRMASVLIVIGMLMFAWSIWRVRRRAGRIATGLSGEEAMGDALSALEAVGFHVLHDLPSGRRSGANVDHVVNGPTGVFAIETKARSKPASGTPRAVFDGHGISFADGPFDSRPIEQATACASDVSATLSELGFPSTVRPVVSIPEWFVETTNGHPWEHEVIVGMEKNLLTFLSYQAQPKPVISNKEIAQISKLLATWAETKRT